jgi:5-methylcytosine-specific restriction endonuclease McrA
MTGGHIAWIRTLSCANCLWQGPNHAHHVKTRGSGGQDEGNLVPLCSTCHSRVHQVGVETFSRQMGIDLADIADKLWAASPANPHNQPASQPDKQNPPE